MLTLIALLTSFGITFSGKKCAFIGLEGIGYPVSTCMYQTEQDPTKPSGESPFAFEFFCDNDKVTAEYWESVTECAGHSDLEMDDYYCAEDPQISGQECKCRGRGRACDVFTITMNTNDTKCLGEEDQSTSIVVNECVASGFGGSQLFKCDDEILSMETWTNDKCEGAGEYTEFDYSYLNTNYCFQIVCSQGFRKIKRCRERGQNIGGQGMIDIMNKHINNHHLFVKDIIAKHKLGLSNQHKSINNWHIFGNELYLVYGLLTVAVALGLIAIIRLCRYVYHRSQYLKI